MDYSLEEYKEHIGRVRVFVKETVAPAARETDGKEAFPLAAVDEMKKRGLFGIPFGTETGGAGLDYTAYALTIEEIAKACASTAVILSTHTSLACYPVAEFGNDLQKEKFLRPLLAGEKLGAFALTEPGAGSDVGAVSTAAREENGRYIINGEKIFITNAGYAGVYIVFAKNASGKLSAFLVPADTPGFEIAGYEKKLGIRGSTAGHLVFQECAVPKENLLGDPNGGFKIAMTALNAGRIAIAAQALGIAEGAFDLAAGYVKERKQFGKSIGEFQNTRFSLAEMRTEIEASRYLMLHAAYLLSRGLPHTKEAAMAKLKCSKTADVVTTACLQLLGGYGYTGRYDAERFFRDARITQIYEGTSEIQKIVISTIELK
jgi:butyryl-CoA dehydrogenase